LHDASGGIQAESAAPGQKDRMHLIDKMKRLERIDLAGSGG
jgi:hypothetical protein